MKLRIVIIMLIAGFASCQNIIEEVAESYDNGQAKTIKFFKGEKSEQNLIKELQYYPDGNPAYQKHFKKNKPSGKWLFWFSNGNVWSKGEYKNGIRVGESLVYHENGQLFFKGMYINGKKQGTWHFYDEEGKLVSESEFNMGESVNNELQVSDSQKADTIKH